jgi:hypothetical protein
LYHPEYDPAVVFWAALTFLLVAVLGSIALAVTRGWRLWKALGTFSGALSEPLARLSVSAAAAEEKANRLDRHATRLEAATVRLQQALAELAVLQAAAAEARAAFATARAAVPRK